MSTVNAALLDCQAIMFCKARGTAITLLLLHRTTSSNLSLLHRMIAKVQICSSFLYWYDLV